MRCSTLCYGGLNIKDSIKSLSKSIACILDEHSPEENEDIYCLQYGNNHK